MSNLKNKNINTDLAGLLVISIEQAVAGPYASGRLADAGARVIKIERPEGDFARKYDAAGGNKSSYFIWLNRGKESICLDLKNIEDKKILINMVKEADVLIQNLMPGAVDRMVGDFDQMQKLNPSLIRCDISGYGSTGDFSNVKAYDLLIQAESGLSLITGAEAEPGRVGVSVCDIAAGMTAYQSILQALYARVKTNEGRQIEVSLFHSLMDWMNVPHLQKQYGNTNVQRVGLNHPTIAPYGVYSAKEGKKILFGIQNEREFQNFCSKILEMASLATAPEFNTNIGRVANRDALNSVINAKFANMEINALAAKFQENNIAFGRLNGLDDLLVHPQTEFISVRSGGKEYNLFSPSGLIKGQKYQLGEVPELDQHGFQLRNEFNI
jgi:crotonobetainyl-CoA:carnitine CoA-transferase CaiB-like acyl-CoA transferase